MGGHAILKILTDSN